MQIAPRAGQIIQVVQHRARGAGQSESETFSELERWIAWHLKSDLRVEAFAERGHRLTADNVCCADPGSLGVLPARPGRIHGGGAGSA
jgi:hypothetical protein